jgi:hypothetical protein
MIGFYHRSDEGAAMRNDDVLPSQTLWLDPGGMTGWAYFTDAFTFHSGQDEFQQLCAQLELTASIHGPSLWLGWEDFIITPVTATRKGSESALEVIGVAKYIATKYEVTILDPAPPSSRELGGLQKLRRLGWYNAGKPHANDAASHLLAYMIRDHVLPADLLKKAVMGDNVTRIESV